MNNKCEKCGKKGHIETHLGKNKEKQDVIKYYFWCECGYNYYFSEEQVDIKLINYDAIDFIL